jgi:hypothetical protein
VRFVVNTLGEKSVKSRSPGERVDEAGQLRVALGCR